MRIYSPVPHPDIHTNGFLPWLEMIQKAGFRASYVPGALAQFSTQQLREVEEEARRRDIILTEVGAWCNNPIHPDAREASKGISKCQDALRLADELGAVCAVNIVGSRNADQWDGPHPENLSRETFDAIVESTRKIVDGVKPRRAKYVLETMPWIFPDSPESYLELLAAIDRDSVGVHLDIANMVNCPARIFRITEFIHHCFDLLGDKIRCIHAKDIMYGKHLTFHISEVAWGEGVMDLKALLSRANQLQPDLPVGLEHMPMEQYPPAIELFRATAKELNIAL